MSEAKTVVLVHGAWHGAWCWDKVVALLEQRSVAVVAIDLPLTSLHDDIDATRAAIDRVGGPVVLCGHSYGGAVITEAGNHADVDHLVYLTAFAVDEGESAARTATDEDLPSTNLAEAFQIEGTSVTLKPELVVAGLYHDCDPADAESARARLRSIDMSCFTTPAGPPAWRDTPSTYVVCTQDQGIHPELQRFMAKRCTASVEWPTAHSPFLNRPDLVAGLLIELAT